MIQHTQHVQGKCYCGKIHFDIELPVFAVIYCHCNMCRNMNGSDYSTWVRVLSSHFTIRQGESGLQIFSVNSTCKSYFCRSCSTTVYTTDADYADSCGVLRGIINADVGQQPSRHFFYDRRQSGVEMNDDLPKFGGESGFEPL